MSQWKLVVNDVECISWMYGLYKQAYEEGRIILTGLFIIYLFIVGFTSRPGRKG
jgi:hypothetical protein